MYKMRERSESNMIVKKPKHGKGRQGKSHISFRARGSITVKAKSREEAEKLFKIQFENILNESTLYTFADNKLDKRWSGLLGVEKPQISTTPKESYFDRLYWRNKKGGKMKKPEDSKYMKQKKKVKKKNAD